MKALSIRQPWAWLVAAGIKKYENRTWPLPRTFAVPQRIYVHAGLKDDQSAYAGEGWLNDWIQERIAGDYTGFARFSHGAIIGEVDIIGSVHMGARIDTRFETIPGTGGLTWAEQGCFAFHLANAELYPEPVPYRGHLGFFEARLDT